MHALVATKYSTPDKYEIIELPIPEIDSSHDVLVKVYAVGINPHDTKEAKGMMKVVHGIPFPKTLAHDFSGVVSAAGSAVTTVKVGDAVFGMLPLTTDEKGTAAEYLLISASELVLKPSNLTHTQAASLPLVLYTASNTLDRAAALFSSGGGGLTGKTVFVQAGLGGTGAATAQLAKHVYGASRVVTAVSTPKVVLVPEYLGDGTVDQVVDYKTQDMVREVGLRGVDCVVDTVGTLTALIALVRSGGVIVSIAGLPPAEEAKKEMPGMVWWLEAVLWVVNGYYGWRLWGRGIRYEFCFGAKRNGILEQVEKWVTEGRFRPVVGRVVDFGDLKAVREGCAEVDRGSMVGKLVIRLVDENND